MNRLTFTSAMAGLALVALAVAAAPAAAQKKSNTAPAAVGLASFAAVQAPEAATEACYGATPKAAQDCAMSKCRKKAGKGACYALTLCAPGGWAGIMGVRVTEVSFADVLCGAPSEAALVAGLKAYCEGHLPQMKECNITQVWNPQGQPVKIERSWAPKDFGK